MDDEDDEAGDGGDDEAATGMMKLWIGKLRMMELGRLGVMGMMKLSLR